MLEGINTRDEYLAKLNAMREELDTSNKRMRDLGIKARNATKEVEKREREFTRRFPKVTHRDLVMAMADQDRRKNRGEAGYVPPRAVPGPSQLDRQMFNPGHDIDGGRYRRPFGGAGRHDKGRRVPSER